MIPVMLILKALVSASDREIFEGVIMKDYENTFLTDRMELLLRSFKAFNLYTGDQCLEYLGDKFRVVLGQPEDHDNMTLGHWLIEKIVLVHLESPRDKFRMLLYVPLLSCVSPITKFASGLCCENYLRWSLAIVLQTTPTLLNTKKFYFPASCMA